MELTQAKVFYYRLARARQGLVAKRVGREEDGVAVPFFSKEEDNDYSHGYWGGSKAGGAQECDWRKVLRVSGRGHVGLEQLECMGEKI